MAFTDFYVATTGSNLSAGSPITGGIYPKAYAAGTFVRATGVFTVALGDPAADGVAVGDFASIYTTAGATVATFIGRITARDATTITVSLTAISGATSAVSETALASTCVVGGTWDGPATTVGFPFNFIAATMTNAAGDIPRVNFINGVSYDISAAITHTLAGPVWFQGYTATVGDSGKFILNGGGNAIVPLAISGADNTIRNAIVHNTGVVSGTGAGLALSGSECLAIGCVVHDVRGDGFQGSGGSNMFVECEAYACNLSNSATTAGFKNNSGAYVAFIRCVAHDNTGSNTSGFNAGSNSTFVGCIADTNGAKGFLLSAVTNYTMIGCDAYNNVSDGVDFSGATALIAYIENCNFVKNGTGGTGYGINSSGSAVRNGIAFNCGFGSGTQANTTGDFAPNAAPLGSNATNGCVIYAADVTPWTDPANGDFRINRASAKGTGRGTFTETAASYAGTIGYPDIGAAQHQESAAAGGGSYAFGG